MIRHTVCPICSDQGITHYLSCTDHFVTGEVFDIYRCGKCGFRFTQNYPEESDSGRYYDSVDYISHSDSKKSITEKAYQIVRRIMLNRKRAIVEKMTHLSSGTILDIGSGTGHFLNTMKVSGWEVKAVEINEKARDYARTHFRIDSLAPDKISDLSVAGFDCITMWHVLEHIYEPYKLMTDISKLLKPGGVCIIALPNSSSFDAQYYEKDWAAWDVPRHLWHFSPSVFSIFAEKNKFELYDQSTLPFDVFYISILSEKYRASKLPLVSGLFMGFIFSIRSLFRKSGNSSVIYFLRKTAY